ncbi:WD40-repeat-containing domain, partial [Trinorchestia longiramus]
MKCLDGSNNVKVYNLTATKAQPEWVKKKKKKKKPNANDDDLLQDFVMPDVSNCIKLSPDGEYLVACGTYKPVMKCYHLSELSVKFERGMDFETNRVEILSDDYSKIAYLQESRYIELHGQGGRVHRLRIPKFGRDLGLHKPSADLYIAASGLTFNEWHGLLTLGTDDGIVQCWDPRDRSRAGTLDCAKHMLEYANSLDEEIRTQKDLRVTSLQYNGPHTLAVGNYTGQIYLYDIRSRSPYLIRDHHNKSPINALHFHTSGNVFSMAPNVLKIWDTITGKAVTSVEGDAAFNDMAVVPGTGLAFFAAEDKAMKAYFIPSLGPAPAWCAHLDAMTEELEEDAAATTAAQYDDYTFVTDAELLELGLKDLVGEAL